jgi:hypothetical protein
MSIIQPPTDSLYKFMAVSGLLILGFSMIWPELRLYELEKQVVELAGETKVLKIESDDLKDDWEIINTDTIELKALMRRIEKAQSRDTKAEARASTLLEKRQRLREEHRKKVTLLQIKIEQSQTKFELQGLAETNIKRLSRVMYMGVTVGLILSFFGFILWYRKVQRWQDIAIRRAAVPEANHPPENKTDDIKGVDERL